MKSLCYLQLVQLKYWGDIRDSFPDPHIGGRVPLSHRDRRPWNLLVDGDNVDASCCSVTACVAIVSFIVDPVTAASVAATYV